MTYKIFVVEDHPAMQQAYADLIEREADWVVCGTATSGREALEKMATARPDLALIDISLDEMNGLELIERIRERWPAMLTLIVSGHDEAFYARKALKAGARGYVMKRRARSIDRAIKQVLAGEIYLSEAMRQKLGQGDGQ